MPEIPEKPQTEDVSSKETPNSEQRSQDQFNAIRTSSESKSDALQGVVHRLETNHEVDPESAEIDRLADDLRRLGETTDRELSSTSELEDSTVDKPSSETMTEIAKNWEYDDKGILQETIISKINRSNAASRLLKQEGQLEDSDLAHIVAIDTDKRHDQQLEDRQKYAKELQDLEAISVTEANARGLEGAKAQLRNRLIKDNRYVVENGPELSAVAEELAQREKKMVEQWIDERVQADKLPWTMPNSELTPEIMDAIKKTYEGLQANDLEPQPDDEFKVPHSMKSFDTKTGYAPQDDTLLVQAGIDHDYNKFTREELQRAGVFFLNRLGDGEQPIFGVPIPDPDSENGVFNVQDRSFLTKEEFEKVYRYQQEHGYGIGELDANDVQMDMLMFALKPDARVSGIRKGHGFVSREDKYGPARSPFVDLGYRKRYGVETALMGNLGENGSRINTTNIHLIDVHPDYPGVSEMFDPNTTAHDQRYMSAGEFVASFYEPPTTEQESLRSMQNDLPTIRERAWVGEWPK